MTPYTSFKYISPPRAEKAIQTSFLGFYEKQGWVAQVKKNGTNSVIFVPPGDGVPFAQTRHADDPEHKMWAFSPASIKAFDQVKTKGWSVYNAELMHSKGNGIRDTNYVHDVLVYDGEYLEGKSYQYRYDLLKKIFKVGGVTSKYIPDGGTESHYVVNDNTWVAKNRTTGFKDLFGRLTAEDEGLVLKNPNGLLSPRDNSGWTVKCRRPHANFGF